MVKQLPSKGKKSLRQSGKKRFAVRKKTSPVGKVLTFGQKTRPRTIVVMFHGLGDNAEGCAKDWADFWAAGLKGALVVVPESPDTIWQDEGTDKPDAGRDWLRQRGTHDIRDTSASIKEIQRVTRERLRHVGGWLDGLLQKHKLTNKDVILAGFSQGNVLACLLGANRGVKATLLCGGVCKEYAFSPGDSRRPDGFVGHSIWPRWEELMPKAAPGTQFFALEGTKDREAPRKKIEGMMANFDTTFRWEKGLWHYQLFYKRFRGVMLKWMQQVEGLST
eukprot:gnl/TRDRNA2_/TRDRNA2_59433_c0_seq1.p1 gnl/TRDRNA2_/TRDRNA2_59433_c0~~gnl/TRDRNA2_/TRDRNA2_59433_c0_seq1.p1  ORF type:complete len:277 (-),score=21.83 gnl/TRDRNA2_/TRDRNA2_59433_c0_seq1:311-1141(-)